MSERKGRRIVSISADFLAGLFVQDRVIAVRCARGLPADVRLVDVRIDAFNRVDVVDMVMESAEWTPVFEGQALERVELRFTPV